MTELNSDSVSLQSDPYFCSILDKLKGLQSREDRLYGWHATVRSRRSDQRLLNSRKDNSLYPGTVRDNVNGLFYSVEIFARHGDPEVMGSFSMVLDPAAELQPQLQEAFESALKSGNPPWTLVQPPDEPYAEVQQVDPLLLADPYGQTEGLRQEASDCCRKLEGVKVNYAELFVNQGESHTTTSTGVNMPSRGSDLYFEVAMEKLPLPNRQEVHNKTTSVDREGLSLEEFIGETASECRALGQIEIPETTSNAVVLLPAKYAKDILGALLGRTSASAEYYQIPHWLPGDTVYDGELADDASPLTISLDPTLPLMGRSTPYFSGGYRSRGGVVIENGIVKEQIVDQRMSCYLNKEVNPLCGNLVIPVGSYSKEELLAQADVVIEIISFLALGVDQSLQTWSSEIKLAREYHRDTGEVRLLKGGVMSGSTCENVRSMQSSSELKKISSGYVGPEYVSFRSGVSIAGR